MEKSASGGFYFVAYGPETEEIMAEETNVQSTETTPDTGGGATYTQTQVDDMVRQATEGMPSA